MTSDPEFPDDFRADLVNLFLWRRDVRRFRPTPLPEGVLERLVDLASLAPSVGLSQPWRFVVVESAACRGAVRACFERCNAEALASFGGERAALYARLKLAGLNEAPCQFAVFADRGTQQGHGLGRLTMPATIEYSAVMAIHTFWLAARAEGIGMGWVSILDPAEMATILDAPPEWTLIGYFCVGYPCENHSVPELEREGWEVRRASMVIRR
ncbi:5,6-dimethylbenzimidazole synthase [Mesorhizobium sp.]|uniref:5,6-dimethylbenzimidazole synthase n=1 Tax=Mesorhizobium sp. TaxID=1871066 RepID=UPI000FE4408C|nr:5,6-dimethylbenzimidazole synthase [Mesorhizobium sp.]RWN55934.1 MAG: 5,6-dimethylbenzimidazole synthase [Mesorhizobium sp.]RWN76502.1 MAG: 5,6-dimethylbenzimidazole synthase [Mesorhizobium sp.]RWN81530.1 MAG: 5,6-dimethylbenzimidazole synthase [Mesorhizobium sp.]RWN90528.1 MAG: 5,6-dimethylbenzimidazole synthase [Mesorhizobium sp.]RWO15530.1 MAG: 5,6-dimethylbenzimidazole synthase [Mesorhizobium sp.]